MRRLSILLSVVLVLSMGRNAFAQGDTRQPNQPIYKITINVVERTTKAINYGVVTALRQLISVEHPCCLKPKAKQRWKASRAILKLKLNSMNWNRPPVSGRST